jgi:two-component system sensor histidine kinase KdpD
MEPSELAVAQWVYEHRQPAGAGTATLPGARALYLPLIGSRGAVGVLGVSAEDQGALESPEQLHQLEAFGNQTAVAVERAKLAEEARLAEVRAETERLRNSLLSSVSHDLRTPLAAITGASSSLLESSAELGGATKVELIRSIHREAERLDRLVNNLLDMTRLESGGVSIRREWQALDGIVGAALKRVERALSGREVHVDIPADLPLLPIDAVLIEQALINILDNAAKYTPPGSPIDIAATADARAVTVEIGDRGPGFAPGDEARIFEKFYRGSSTERAGAGLGLAICRAIIASHGGRIWAENRPGGGALFRFTLPLEERPPTLSADDA